MKVNVGVNQSMLELLGGDPEFFEMPINELSSAFMWVFGSMVFLIPVAAIIMQVLSARGTSIGSRTISAEQRTYVERKAE
jgi:hypothetical protein